MGKLLKGTLYPLEKDYELLSHYLNNCNSDQLIEVANLVLTKMAKLKNEELPTNDSYCFVIGISEKDGNFNYYEDIE